MSAEYNKKNPVIRGDDYDLVFVMSSAGVATNLTGYTGVTELRKDKNQLNPDLTITCSITALTGTVTTSFTDTQTSALDGRYFYKVKLTTGSITRTKLKGILTFTN
jgi:hypothetical protein